MKLEIFQAIIESVKVGHKLHESSYLLVKSYIPNFTSLVPSLDVKKFVVAGYYKWTLVLSFRPTLDNDSFCNGKIIVNYLNVSFL